MWILYILVVTLQGVTAHSVDRYVTQEDCLKHKQQFEKDFTVSYPGDEDWAFVCVKPKDKET